MSGDPPTQEEPSTTQATTGVAFALQKKAGGGGKWPPGAQDWLQRAMASVASFRQKDQIQVECHKELQKFKRSGSLWTVNWKNHPFPRIDGGSNSTVPSASTAPKPKLASPKASLAEQHANAYALYQHQQQHNLAYFSHGRDSMGDDFIPFSQSPAGRNQRSRGASEDTGSVTSHGTSGSQKLSKRQRRREKDKARQQRKKGTPRWKSSRRKETGMSPSTPPERAGSALENVPGLSSAAQSALQIAQNISAKLKRAQRFNLSPQPAEQKKTKKQHKKQKMQHQQQHQHQKYRIPQETILRGSTLGESQHMDDVKVIGECQEIEKPYMQTRGVRVMCA